MSYYIDIIHAVYIYIYRVSRRHVNTHECEKKEVTSKTKERKRRLTGKEWNKDQA